jgi:hypothetical protein
MWLASFTVRFYQSSNPKGASAGLPAHLGLAAMNESGHFRSARAGAEARASTRAQ